MKNIIIQCAASLVIASSLAIAEDVPLRVQSVTDNQEHSSDDERPMALAADLVKCSVERTSEDALIFTITVAGKIPLTVDNRAFYAIYIDLDNSALTGNCDRHRGTDLCIYSQKLPGEESGWTDSVILDSSFVLEHDYKIEHELSDDRTSIKITAKSSAFTGKMDFLYRVTTGIDCSDVMPAMGAFARYYDFPSLR